MMATEIIPVIDLLNGVVVHGIAGQRASYLPIKSKLTNSAEFETVLDALISHTNAKTVYIADLDSIHQKKNPFTQNCFNVLQKNKYDGINFWVDFGIGSIGDFDDFHRLSDSQNISFVLGTETISELKIIDHALKTFGVERVVISLDHKNHSLQSKVGSSFEICEYLVHNKIATINVIILDVSLVGTKKKPIIYLSEIVSLIQQFPAFSFYIGGGIQTMNDIQTVALSGGAGVLMATALHNQAFQTKMTANSTNPDHQTD